ncbi:MAG TPA: bifunctional hydroxymethylpyrimidine kinase/phosphomethylpyrimidine kinase [Verrucomicrobiae bacterium]|nr:bifunctional hydroxymethylpyrimidine kinase/phosphomethylpyrimidine kinase [Verrucomicrobiae bacterium]
MKRRSITAVALTVAGSDSGGGAGIQADLKVFHAHGVFGTSAITCITAQNPSRVSAVQALPPRLVAEQMDRVFEAFPVRGAKTGMLYDAAIIEAVADRFARRKFARLVVDPVMVASSGAVLLRKDAVAALTSKLFPLAAVVTPNLAEAEVLVRRSIRTIDDLRTAACALAEKHGVPFLVKGGHLPGVNRAVDVLYDGRRFWEFRAAMVPKIKTHGTGCAFSAAIAANLTLGPGLAESIGRAKRFVTAAIRNSLVAGKYRALRI